MMRSQTRRDKEELEREECMGRGYDSLGFFEFKQRQSTISTSMGSQPTSELEQTRISGDYSRCSIVELMQLRKACEDTIASSSSTTRRLGEARRELAKISGILRMREEASSITPPSSLRC